MSAPADEDGLVRAILADPWDGLARSAYADWLEENNDFHHAGLMRLPPAGLARRPPLGQVGSGYADWLETLGLPGAAGGEQRDAIRRMAASDAPVSRLAVAEVGGLPVATMPAAGYRAEAFQTHGAAWLRRHRIALLALTGPATECTEALALPVAGHLRGLRVVLDSRAARGLAAASLPRLAWLDLSGSDIGKRGYDILADADGLPGVVRLDVRGVAAPAPHLLTLLRGPLGRGLRHLDLSDAPLRDGHELVRCAALSGVVTLNLSGYRANYTGILASSHYLGALRNLDLTGNVIDVIGWRTLAGSGLMGRLRRLAMSDERDDTLELLVKSAHPDCRFAIRVGDHERREWLRDVFGERLVLE